MYKNVQVVQTCTVYYVYNILMYVFMYIIIQFIVFNALCSLYYINIVIIMKFNYRVHASCA